MLFHWRTRERTVVAPLLDREIPFGGREGRGGKRGVLKRA